MIQSRKKPNFKTKKQWDIIKNINNDSFNTSASKPPIKIINSDSDSDSSDKQTQLKKQNKIHISYNCDKCDGILVQSEDGFLTCTNTQCGKIMDNMLEHGAEWKYNEAGDIDHARSGMPINTLLEESSFGCIVSSYSKKVTPELYKIKRLTEWLSMPYKEKTNYHVFEYIKNMGNNANLSKMLIDDALFYYKKLSNESIQRGINRDGLIASSIYISCKVNGFPRTPNEIAIMFKLDTANAIKGCKIGTTILNQIDNEKIVEDKTTFESISSIDFIQRFCSKLGLSDEIIKVVKFVCMIVEKNKIMNNNTPHSIASGVIYYVNLKLNLGLTKSQIKKISDVSEVTINKCCKKIEEFNNELIPHKILEKYKGNGNNHNYAISHSHS